MIVDQPFAEPQPFMGPVYRRFLLQTMSRSNGSNLMMKGGKPLRRLDRQSRTNPS